MDGGGKTAAHRALPVEVFHQRLEGMSHGGRGGWLRRHQSVTFTNQLARCGVDQASLDPRATDIPSQHMHQLVPFIVPTIDRRQSMKKWLRSGKGQIVYA